MRTLVVLTAVCFAGPVLGQFFEPIGWLQLWLSPLMLSAMIGALVVGARRGQRRALFLLPVLALSFVLSARVTLGVPQWVKAKAQPLITGLEQWKLAHQSYPESAEVLHDELKASGCHSYSLRPTGFHLICQGVFMTKCVYDSNTQHWYGWD